MKHIDAEKLIAEIESHMEDCKLPDGTFPTKTNAIRYEELSCLRNFVASLQQEMELPEKYQTPDWLFDKLEQQVLPGIEESGIPGKDFIPVEWVDACERYGKWKIVKQEQPDNEDIDKVAQELYEHLYELKRRNSVPTNLYDKQEIIDLWKAGIEYGRNHPKQEQPEVELEDDFFFDEVLNVFDSFKRLPPRDKETLDFLENLARHFWNKGYNARKEQFH